MTEAGAVIQAEKPNRGWRKLLLALFVFVLAPSIPQLRALLPVDETNSIIVSSTGFWLYAHVQKSFGAPPELPDVGFRVSLPPSACARFEIIFGNPSFSRR